MIDIDFKVCAKVCAICPTAFSLSSSRERRTETKRQRRLIRTVSEEVLKNRVTVVSELITD